MTLEIAHDRIEEVETEKDRVVRLLEEALEDIKGGEISPNLAFITLIDSNIDTFEQASRYVGRAVSIVGYIEVAKNAMVSGDILGE